MLELDYNEVQSDEELEYNHLLYFLESDEELDEFQDDLEWDVVMEYIHQSSESVLKAPELGYNEDHEESKSLNPIHLYMKVSMV